MRLGKHYMDDYDLKRPKASLLKTQNNPAGHAHDKYEIYEFPGDYVKEDDGRECVCVRLEEHLSERSVAHGEARGHEDDGKCGDIGMADEVFASGPSSNCRR